MLKAGFVGSCSRLVGLRRMSGGGAERGRGENRLGQELSPYLRQHKDNPVDWFPWGQEAIKRAKSENKMIFLSIGYSTCHWCHVMERESFENVQVAEVMNKHFINIKIDREERPDVDKVYMTFVQATTGSGGWPLSVFLSPSLKPVYGGTYFPPSSSFGRPGFRQILEALSTQWTDNKEDMMEAGDQVLAILEQKVGGGADRPGPLPPSPKDTFQRFFGQLSSSYDEEFGGYSGPPKFPQPSNILTMFKLHQWSGEVESRRKRGLEMNLHTLDMMARGGIHDHISQGFCRYSTDAQWHVPHFEKMLYDQAQLMVVYSIAAQLTGSPSYSHTVEDIFTYVTRDLTHPLGGFFSAEDADSLPAEDGSRHKREGAFCVWTHQEILSLLGETVTGTEFTLADVIIHEYNVKPGGNVNPRGDPHGELRGQNVLTQIPNKEPLFDEGLYQSSLDKARKILYDARQTRPRPGLDDKILCSWNGLMISALAKAGTGLATPPYTQAAVRAANFVRENMLDTETGVLLRSVYGGKPELEQLPQSISGFVDDYVFMIQAFLDLYEATFDSAWLELAVKLQERQDDLFLDPERGGYYCSREGQEDIVLRLKDDHDGAEPSSNSISALNLLRLGKLVGEKKYVKNAENVFKLYSSRLTQTPVVMPALVDAFLYHVQNAPLVVFTGPVTGSALAAEIRSKFLPALTFASFNPESANSVLGANTFLSDIDTTESSIIAVTAVGEKLTISSLEELENLVKSGGKSANTA